MGWKDMIFLNVIQPDQKDERFNATYIVSSIGRVKFVIGDLLLAEYVG